MERDRLAHIADLANAVRHAHHAKKEEFTRYMFEMRNEAW